MRFDGTLVCVAVESTALDIWICLCLVSFRSFPFFFPPYSLHMQFSSSSTRRHVLLFFLVHLPAYVVFARSYRPVH
jgi:hypothetical protein